MGLMLNLHFQDEIFSCRGIFVKLLSHQFYVYLPRTLAFPADIGKILVSALNTKYITSVDSMFTTGDRKVTQCF